MKILTTRDGVEITEIDPTTSYVGTADGMTACVTEVTP